ncbi:Molybdate transporter 1 [Forsythia ovata]|uniref:Molybdate transporter 1 n=1 Tax=Forsythia ovata TaxID=205694 RepID=A0ABD1PXG2_9LAMI
MRQLEILLITTLIITSYLFPEKDVSTTSVFQQRLCFSATLCCHGDGGLVEQYKFGGSSGRCVALLGVAKLVLELVLCSFLVKILDQFPVGVSGVLLLFAGIALAMCSRDMNSKEKSSGSGRCSTLTQA